MQVKRARWHKREEAPQQKTSSPRDDFLLTGSCSVLYLRWRKMKNPDISANKFTLRVGIPEHGAQKGVILAGWLADWLAGW